MDAKPLINPLEDTNLELLSHVHPKQWRNPDGDEVYDLLVIGAGTAGLVTASGAARLGARVALIERALMGGDCLNVGCVPSKRISARTIQPSVSRVLVSTCSLAMPSLLDQLRLQ